MPNTVGASLVMMSPATSLTAVASMCPASADTELPPVPSALPPVAAPPAARPPALDPACPPMPTPPAPPPPEALAPPVPLSPPPPDPPEVEAPENSLPPHAAVTATTAASVQSVLRGKAVTHFSIRPAAGPLGLLRSCYDGDRNALPVGPRS